MYQRPAYTILGNHDWRLNPYPPFAVAGSPNPRALLHDYAKLNLEKPKGDLSVKDKALIKDQERIAKEQEVILRLMHGPGDRRKFSYSRKAEDKGQLLFEDPGGALKTIARMIGHTQTMDEPEFPAHTTVDSVAWYLLSINPFLDYWFTLPGQQKVLMLDWAEDENVLFPIVQRGKEIPYMLWQASEAADPGPKARNCLTALQKHLVKDFSESSGKAKIIGIHAPPIGPYPDWFDTDLLKGRKIYERPKEARGPTNYVTEKADGTREKWNGHPLFAVRPKGGAAGMEADYGSFESNRDWFIKTLAAPTSGVRIVLSGHIHRNGLYVVHVPATAKDSVLAGQLLLRGVIEQAVRGARPPAVTLTPEGKHGPLYINTTSAGPRGHWHPTPGQAYDVDPGYAHVELSDDGMIRQVEFRPARMAQPSGLSAYEAEAGDEAESEAEKTSPKAGSIRPGVDGNDFSGAPLCAASGSSVHEQSSLSPGGSIIVDGQNVGTYVDAIAWYTTRRDILLEQKRAFVKDGYLVPNGLDDLAAAADARIKMMSKLGSQPVSDSHVESMLGWLDVYLKVMKECDQKTEVIAADRFRATLAEIEKMKEQAARLQPQLRDLQRSAFRSENKSKLKQAAETFATMLDNALVAEQWVRDAVTNFDDIRALGTTLRTQKALHGSSQPWHELMRKTTNAKIAKLLSAAQALNKTLAVWQLFDASLALLSGGKTSSDRTSAGIALTTTVASAGGTLLGASGFFTLYNNLYIGPMVKRILGQIDQLKDQISIGRNRPFIQLGRLDQVNWDIEPGGREMYEFMHGVMRARSATDIGAIPASVSKYFSKHQGAFDAGTPKRHGVDINYADFNDTRDWVFGFRDDIWGMLYGSMPVP